MKNSFQEIIMNTVWLDKWTKQKALHKVRNIETFISHDSWIENYHNIEQLYANVSKYFKNLSQNTYRIHFNYNI